MAISTTAIWEDKLTEDQAKQTWCPFAKPMMVSENQVAIAHGRSFTREGNGGGKITSISENCLGAECMAWRWERSQLVFRDRAEGDELVGTVYKTTPEPDSGYCGLAGRP